MRVDVSAILGTPWEQMNCADVVNFALDRLGKVARLPDGPPEGEDSVWSQSHPDDAKIGDVALQRKEDGNWGVYILVDEGARLWLTSIPEHGAMCVRVGLFKEHIHSFWRCIG